MTAVLAAALALGLTLAVQAMWQPRSWRLPRLRVAHRREPAMWPDVVDDLVASVVAGVALPQAFGRLATHGPRQLQPHFAAAVEVLQRTGDFPAAVTTLRNSVDDALADTFCAALTVAHRVGGRDLGRLLRSLSAVLREDIRVRGELEARQSWTVSGARIAVAAPWATVLLLSTRSDASAAYQSRTGLVLLTGCAIVTVTAYLAMRSIGRLPQGARL